MSRPESYMASGVLLECPTGWQKTAAATRSGAFSISLSANGTADAVAHEEELVYAEVVHQAKLVVGERAPRVLDLHRAARLSADSVALVHRDAAEVVFEHLHRVEDLVGPAAYHGVQSPAGRDQ